MYIFWFYLSHNREKNWDRFKVYNLSGWLLWRNLKICGNNVYFTRDEINQRKNLTPSVSVNLFWHVEYQYIWWFMYLFFDQFVYVYIHNVLSIEAEKRKTKNKEKINPDKCMKWNCYFSINEYKLFFEDLKKRFQLQQNE